MYGPAYDLGMHVWSESTKDDRTIKVFTQSCDFEEGSDEGVNSYDMEWSEEFLGLIALSSGAPDPNDPEQIRWVVCSPIPAIIFAVLYAGDL
jgi:hypothetical protein